MNWVIEVVFPRRLQRLAYFLRSIAIEVVTSFLYTTSTTMKPLYFWCLISILIIYGFFFIFLPRLGDAGMSPWWIVAGFLVFPVGIALSILLLFRPSDYHFPRPAPVEQPAVTA